MVLSLDGQALLGGLDQPLEVCGGIARVLQQGARASRVDVRKHTVRV
jgi:hypothetical protein